MPRQPEDDASEPEDFHSRGQETQDRDDLLAGRLPSESELPMVTADPLQSFIDSNIRLFHGEGVPKADESQ